MAPIGGGFALPHPGTRVTLGRDSGLVALIMIRDGIPHAESAGEEAPLTRLLFFIAPSPRAHLDLIGRLSRLLSRGPMRALIAQGAPDEEILLGFDAFDAEIASAPGKETGQ
jgi:PTS system nitrogen regulatory IIA component